MAMTLKAFQKLIASYGTETARWPEGEREAALDLLQKDEKAVAIFKAANPLDALLGDMPSPAKADDAYLKRLATIPFASRSLGEDAPTTFGDFMKGFFPARTLLPRGVGFAAVGILGIWLGVTATTEPQEVLELDPTDYFLENNDLTRDYEDLR